MGCFTAEPNGTPKQIIASPYSKYLVRGPFGPGNNSPYECRGSRYAKAPDARDLPLPKRTRPDSEPRDLPLPKRARLDPEPRDLSPSGKLRPHKYPEPECSHRVGSPLGCSAVGGEPEGASGDYRNDIPHFNHAGNPVGHTSILMHNDLRSRERMERLEELERAWRAFKREGKKSTLKFNPKDLGKVRERSVRPTIEWLAYTSDFVLF